MRTDRRRATLRELTTAGLILVVVAALGAPAVAQQAPTKEQLIPEEGGSITLDVKERPLKDIVDYIRDKTNVNIIVSQDAEAELDLIAAL